jgi:hypothetical protein
MTFDFSDADRLALCASVEVIKASLETLPEWRLRGATMGTMSAVIWTTLALVGTEDCKPLEKAWQLLPRRGFLGLSTERHFPDEITKALSLQWDKIVTEGANTNRGLHIVNPGIIRPKDELGLVGGDEWIFTMKVMKNSNLASFGFN